MSKVTTKLNAVIKALKAGENIENIDLHKSKIGNKDVELLVQALSQNNTVKYINWGYNHISNKGAMLIAELLKNNDSINRIDLCHNKISDKGTKRLLQALEENNHILILDLLENNKIDIGLAKDVMKLLQRNILKNLETLPNENDQNEGTLDKKLQSIVQKLKETQQQLGVIIEEINSYPLLLQEHPLQSSSLLGNMSLMDISELTDSVNNI